MILLLFYSTTFSQSVKCCDEPSCKERAQQLANKITPLADLVPAASSADVNKKKLEELRRNNLKLYNDFMSTMNLILDFLIKDGVLLEDRNTCFADAIPLHKSGNIKDWILYLHEVTHPVSFPSPEFCAGWKRRFELSQGAANLFNLQKVYSASVKGYLIHTFGKANSCGNKLRLMAGPAIFLQNRTVYTTLSSRLAWRFRDIKEAKIPIYFGNLNVFGEFSTSFKRYHLAALGIEAQLGPYGVNFSINHNMHSGNQGFQIGIVFCNKNIKI